MYFDFVCFKFVCLSMYLINATHIPLFVPYFSYFVVDTSYSMKTKKSNNAGDGTYRCEACNFETKYSQNLQAHFKTLKHLGNTRMSCEESAIKMHYITSFSFNYTTKMQIL